MPRINAIQKSEASAGARQVLDGIEKKLGKVPNMLLTMANSQAVLESYVGFSTALGKGSLSAKLREQIALAVGEQNTCQYCLSAHAALGKMAGLSEEEITDSRRGQSPDRKTEAALAFARKIVSERGNVNDDDVKNLRSVGFSDGEIGEIVANTALNIFTNYFNHVAGPEIDFPEVATVGAGPACACGTE